MSYILEALRKADAQRERSNLPGLQAQPHAASEAAPPIVPRTAWVTVGAALVLGSVGFAAWQALRGEVAPATAAVAPAAATAVAAAPLPPEPAAEILPPAPPAPAPAAVKTPAAAEVAMPLENPHKGDEPRAQVPVAGSASAPPPRRGAVALAATEPTPAPAPAMTTKAGGPTAADAVSSRVPAGAPSLAVSGGVWSHSPAHRLLIVNGQVFNEGSELAPGVRLEEVKQHQAVLSFRGQRYAVPY